MGSERREKRGVPPPACHQPRRGRRPIMPRSQGSHFHPAWASLLSLPWRDGDAFVRTQALQDEKMTLANPRPCVPFLGQVAVLEAPPPAHPAKS